MTDPERVALLTRCLELEDRVARLHARLVAGRCVPACDVERMREMRRRGFSQREIAARLGWSETTVQRHMKRG